MVLGVVGVGAVHAADDDEAKFGEIMRVKAVPPLVAAVKEAGGVLNGRSVWQKSASEVALSAGSQAVAVVELRGKGTPKQWMMMLRVAEDSDDDADVDTKPEPDRVARVFSSTGRMFAFPTSKVPLALAVFGPVELDKRGLKKAEDGKLKHQEARRNVSEGFLRLGFADFAAAWVDLRERGGPVGPGLGTNLRPYPEDLAAKVAEIAAKAGWTEENDRAFAGTMPALFEFVTVILKTPAMAEIMWEVVDVPWMSMVGRKGKMPSINFQYEPNQVRRLGIRSGESTEYRDLYVVPFKFMLNGKLALNVELVVRKPEGAARLAAGVVALEARDPRDASKRVLVKFLGFTDGEIRSDEDDDAQ